MGECDTFSYKHHLTGSKALWATGHVVLKIDLFENHFCVAYTIAKSKYF